MLGLLGNWGTEGPYVAYQFSIHKWSVRPTYKPYGIRDTNSASVLPAPRSPLPPRTLPVIRPDTALKTMSRTPSVQLLANTDEYDICFDASVPLVCHQCREGGNLDVGPIHVIVISAQRLLLPSLFLVAPPCRILYQPAKPRQGLGNTWYLWSLSLPYILVVISTL